MPEHDDQTPAFNNTYSYRDLPKTSVTPSHAPHRHSRKMYAAYLVLLIMAITAGFIYVLRINTPPSSYATYHRTNAARNVISPSITAPSPIQKREVIGFLPSWSIANNVKVPIQNLTQIIYFGLGVNDNGELIKYNDQGVAVAEWHYLTSPYFKALQKEAKQHGTKILIAIKNFDNENIDNLISNERATRNFISQVVDIVQQSELDGVNVDFEYFTDSEFPTSRYLNRFLTELNTALNKADPALLLSIDVNATVVIHDRAYDMVKIGEIVDQVIIMGYDYTRAQSTRAGHIAPLYAAGEGHSIDQTVTSLAGRVHPDKIILALPFYGYEWQTVSTQYQSPTIEHTGALATYGRVQKLLVSRDDVVEHWDETAAAPWLTYYQSGAVKAIYYEDARSWEKKIAYARDQKLGGVGIWALGYEGDNADSLWKTLTGHR